MYFYKVNIINGIFSLNLRALMYILCIEHISVWISHISHAQWSQSWGRGGVYWSPQCSCNASQVSHLEGMTGLERGLWAIVGGKSLTQDQRAAGKLRNEDNCKFWELKGWVQGVACVFWHNKQIFKGPGREEAPSRNCICRKWESLKLSE